jgi:choline transport protein
LKAALGTRLLTYPQQVSRRYNSPLNAVYVTTFLSLVLCLVNLGSNVAFNIIISLNLVAFLVTYLLSIGCVLWKRLQHEPLPPAKFSLGRWGVPINIFAVLYSTLAIVLSCFPVSLPVDAVDANWAPAIMAAVLVIALVSYLLQGRKIYEGPVVFVEGRRKANVGLQSVEAT